MCGRGCPLHLDTAIIMKSVLPQQKWSSSVAGPSNEITVRSRTHYLASKRTITSAGLSRPESRASAGPSRPQSRGPEDRVRSASLGHRKKEAHPRSTVRPLSGNIFIRRSSKHGWTAKAYPEAYSSSSQPNLDLEDFSGGSYESFDSFFDDEFEEKEKTEKLGNLLSCNTLGVETKSAKQDWISGEVDIPTFHCPRCRDHWYGVSSVPCDEELARLIREGLWQTGNSSKDTKNTRNAREFSLESTKNNKSEAFYSGGRLQARIPSLKSNTYRNKSNSDLDNWEMKRGKEALGEKRNRKKRITFHLDNNDANNDDDADGATGSRESGTQLQGLVEEGPYTGSGEEGAGNGSIGEASGISGIVSSVGSEVVEDATSGDISGEHNIIVGTGRQSGDTYTDGSKDGPNFTRDDNLRKASSQAADHDTTKEAKGSGKLTSHQQREASHGKGGGLSGLEDDWRGNMGAVEDVELRGSGSGRGRQTGAVGDGMSEDREGVDRKQEHVSELENGEALDGSENENNRNRSSHRNGNQSPSTSTGSGKTPGSEKVENSLTKLTHYGKRVRKNGGYMRAVSPTSSKWGDPLHARSFLSSTSTGVSRTPSTSSLTQDNNTSSSSSGELGFRTKKGSQFLPPIVNPIHSSPFTSIEGPSITRPWIFSYH